MISNLELSKLFWVSLAFVYVFVILAVYSIVTLPENTFSADSSEQVMAAVKLTYVRLSLAVVSSVVYPILLFSSLKYTKYVTIALTAWAVDRYYLRCDLTADCLLKALCKPLHKSLGTP